MPETESYDVLVIGSGEAGKYLAWTMAKAGHGTAVVERRYVERGHARGSTRCARVG